MKMKILTLGLLVTAMCFADDKIKLLSVESEEQEAAGNAPVNASTNAPTSAPIQTNAAPRAPRPAPKTNAPPRLVAVYVIPHLDVANTSAGPVAHIEHDLDWERIVAIYGMVRLTNVTFYLPAPAPGPAN